MKVHPRTSLVVQRLRLCAPNTGGSDSTPGQRSRSFLHDATTSSNAATKGSTGRN